MEAFPVENEHRPIWINGLLVPPKSTRELLEMFPKLPFRKEDVIVATYPKSGTTWVNEILWQIHQDGSVSQSSIHERLPFLDFLPHDQNKSVQEIINLVETHSSQIYKTHFSCDIVLKSPGSGAPKYVYVMRNPKDTAVSYFHFYVGIKKLCFDKTWDEFFEMFISGQVMYGSWFDHVLGWWQRRDDPNVLIMKYEDMKKDLPAAIQQITTFINKTLSPEVVTKIAQQTTFDSMKDKKEYSLGDTMREEKKFLRKGEVGDWHNYFTEEQNRRMDAMIEEKLSGTGLEFDY